MYIQWNKNSLDLQIVGLGLCGVFELIRETRNKYPELCIKALRALLDLLQGQYPESMKSEPVDVVCESLNLKFSSC